MEPSDETYEDLKENIAWNVRVRRKARELKQGELAELADTSVTTICQIENGNAKNMTLVVLCNIAKALDIDFTTLISPFTAHGYGEIDSKSCKNLSENEAIQRIRQTEIQKTYYPPLNRYHEISSMLELALILPLIDLAELYDICQRIKGDAIGFEDYISSFSITAGELCLSLLKRERCKRDWMKFVPLEEVSHIRSMNTSMTTMMHWQTC